MPSSLLSPLLAAATTLSLSALPAQAPRTHKPPLHARHWIAITGKPLAATAGAMTFHKGGNAIDAAAAMLAAVCTMWDTLGWGGETQALLWHPVLKRVIGINALGVAPTGATAQFYRDQGKRYPPEHGPLAAITPGTPGGLMTMVAEYGRLSLKDVLGPAIQMADGYAIEAQAVDAITKHKARIEQWRYSPAVFLPRGGRPPEAGEVFVQKDLAATLRKLVEAEDDALQAGKSRKDAILAAYQRFYRGDIAKELVRAAREEGGLLTLEDLGRWKVKIEEPVTTMFQGITVCKLQPWTQGPAFLQALNILENVDLASLGHNSARYLHTLYQAMSMAFADRDFYYGDPAFADGQPIAGLLSKGYAKQRFGQLDPLRNDAAIKPGDPYPFEGRTNPHRALLGQWTSVPAAASQPRSGQQDRVPDSTEGKREETAAARACDREAPFYAGTTSIQAADAEGWVISVTPSGAWIPAVIAGHTGIGLSQRAQSFVTAPEDGPFNVIEPGKRPRVTLTPTLALKDGAPYLAFSVQGGDSQDQNLLQFFLNVVVFKMTPQQAAEAPNINSFQMRSSFGAHEIRPGHMLVAESVSAAVREELRKLGYVLEVEARTSGPITAILFDRLHQTMWGAASNHGEDHGIGW